VEKTPTGAILYDRQVISEMSESRFTPSAWLHAEPVSGALRSAGRGNTMYVGNVPRQFVLRHYLRGGLIGKVVRDSYLWSGQDNTRPFAEWRMLAKILQSGHHYSAYTKCRCALGVSLGAAANRYILAVTWGVGVRLS